MKSTNNSLSETDETKGINTIISVYPSMITLPKTVYSTTVNINCADTQWTISGGNSWCYVTKISSFQARIDVSANSGSLRTVNIQFISGANHVTLVVNQRGVITSYDRSSMINVYQQDQTLGDCAGTCCCMVVKHTKAQVNAVAVQTDGPGTDWVSYAQWSKIAQAYGMSTYHMSSGTPATGNLSGVFDVLQSGYPAIAKINTESSEHWVVICSYSGDDKTNPNYYTCADPWTGTTRILSNATNYNSVSKYCYFA